MPVPTRTSADANSSADINTLQSQITGGLGFDFRSTGTNATLTSAEANSRLYYTLSANINITLDDDFSEGNFVEIHLSTAAYKVTLKSQDGDTICTMIPGSWLIIAAKQDAPTDATHWKTMDAGGTYVTWAIPGTQGFGTITDSGECLIRRVGGNAEIHVLFGAGTTTASEARVTLPFSLSTSSVLTGLTPVSGSQFGDALDPPTIYQVIASASLTYINFWSQSGATTIQANNGNTITTTSGRDISFVAVVPIAGWEIG